MSESHVSAETDTELNVEKRKLIYDFLDILLLNKPVQAHRRTLVGIPSVGKPLGRTETPDLLISMHTQTLLFH